MLYTSFIASYSTAGKPFANPCGDCPAKILPQFTRTVRDAPFFFRRFFITFEGERFFRPEREPRNTFPINPQLPTRHENTDEK